MGFVTWFVFCVIYSIIKQEVINWRAAQKNKINYLSNGVELEDNLAYYYAHLLGLLDKTYVSPKIVYGAYYEKLTRLEGLLLSREKQLLIELDLLAAKAYMIDFCQYRGIRN